MSHPSWVCGLKLDILVYVLILVRSHPSWVCGLKLVRLDNEALIFCHTLRGCVD